MNLQEFNSPLPKQWLQINCDTLTANEIVSIDRVRQDGGHLSSYGLWSGTNVVTFGGLLPSFAMGTFVGPVLIPSTSCYDGMSVRVIATGTLTTLGAEIVTFSLRNLANTFVHSSCPINIATAITNAAVRVEFDVGILKTGIAGVAIEAVSAQANTSTVSSNISNNVNTTTFTTIAGVELYLYVQFTVNTSSFTRQTANATVLN